MKQKPYKEYKEELKHLKKEILSGLDITNFPIKRQTEIKNPLIVNEPFNTFSKGTIQEAADSNEIEYLNKENNDKFNQPTL